MAFHLSIRFDEEELKLLAKAASKNETALFNMMSDIMAQMEIPWEVISQMSMGLNKSAALRAMGLVEALEEGTKTCAELASTKGDERLIVRLLRPLCSLGVFLEDGFQKTDATRALNVPAAAGMFKFTYDQAAVGTVHPPQRIVETDFQEPAGGYFRATFSTNLDLFSWLVVHPREMSNFNDGMAGQRLNRVDVAPIDDILLNGHQGGNTPVLVDIGGNHGYDIETLKENYSAFNGNGELIPQDLPQVIADVANLEKEVVRQGHGFPTPQPVRGAKVYYMRYITHDYSNLIDQQILKDRISKLLVFDFILPHVGTRIHPFDVTLV